MAITVKHSKVSTIPDDADTSLVRPSDWNADHTLTGTVPVANGGTGASTANGGFNALAPSQTGNSGKYLTTDGTDTSWATNPLGTVTSVAATAGTGISVTGSPITTSGTLNITNTAPDQTVSIANGTGISATGTYPAFTVTNTGVTSAVAGTGISVSGATGAVTVTNSAPDQTVSITGAGTSVVTGTYPNFTVTSTDSTTGTVTSVAATAGTGISVSGSPITTSGTLNITNTAPDQTVVLTAGTGISTSGTYPNFTITNTSPSSGGTVTSVTGTSPVVSSGGNTPAISMPAATTSVSGYLTSTDWTTFNNKSNTSGTVTSVAALTLGTTGTDLSSTVATGTTTPVITLQVPTASATNRGALSAADWTTFNNKGSGTVTSVSGTTGRITSTGGATPIIDLASGVATAGTTGSSSLIPVVTIDTYGRVTGITTASNPQGTVTSVTGTAPVVSSGGATPAISMAAATTSVSGYLTSTDWNTFNGKAPATTYTSTYVPYGQGTTTPNQSSSYTFDGTTQTAPIQRASNGIVVNSNTVSTTYSIPSGSNAMSAGPITINSGITVTVASGSRWVVL